MVADESSRRRPPSYARERSKRISWEDTALPFVPWTFPERLDTVQVDVPYWTLLRKKMAACSSIHCLALTAGDDENVVFTSE